MTFELKLGLILAASFWGGAMITWLVLRFRTKKAYDSGKAATAPEIERLNGMIAEKDALADRLQNRLSEMAERENDLSGAYNRLSRALAVEEQKNKAMNEIKAGLLAAEEKKEGLERELRKLTADLAREQERTATLMDAQKKLALRETIIDELKQEISKQKTVEGRLQTQMAEERKQAAEKLALLSDARSELTNQFRVLAQEVLEEKSRTFNRQSETGLKSLLDPFRDQLSEFRQKVDSVYVNEAKQRASLKKEIEDLRDLNRQISQEAINLTHALKGDKKAQGTWGEMILERVLEQSGLRKGIEYEAQGGFRDADGKLLKPDVIVHLPEEKDVVVDSKVSLVAYERYASAEVEDERGKALSGHITAVRNHIQALSGKDYAALKGLRSLDFVLMFMPVEAAFVAAFREDETLYSYAFEQRIVVVTPSTLLATLKTIENIWRYERQNRSAQAIFDRASAIYDKLRLFVESMEKLGKQLTTAQGTYEEAMNRLVRGKGNVISQAVKFSDLGVCVKKPIPRTVTDIADIEGLPGEEKETPAEPAERLSLEAPAKNVEPVCKYPGANA